MNFFADSMQLMERIMCPMCLGERDLRPEPTVESDPLRESCGKEGPTSFDLLHAVRKRIVAEQSSLVCHVVPFEIEISRAPPLRSLVGRLFRFPEELKQL